MSETTDRRMSAGGQEAGEWRAIKVNDEWQIVAPGETPKYAETDVAIAVVRAWDGEPTPERAEANARAIASLPALLAALEPFAKGPCERYRSGLVTCITDVVPNMPADADPCRTCAARAAIAAARGEEGK